MIGAAKGLIGTIDYWINGRSSMTNRSSWGKRQAGAAIEGALRQTAVEKLERLAVDTHGFTHFAMAVGKFCGFDLLSPTCRASEAANSIFRADITARFRMF